MRITDVNKFVRQRTFQEKLKDFRNSTGEKNVNKNRDD